MNELFEVFAAAYAANDGYALAQTFTPVPPPSNPLYLDRVRQSINPHNVKSDIKRFLTSKVKVRSISNDEVKGWVEVYEVYWQALGDITAGGSGEVCPRPHGP